MTAQQPMFLPASPPAPTPPVDALPVAWVPETAEDWARAKQRARRWAGKKLAGYPYDAPPDEGEQG